MVDFAQNILTAIAAFILIIISPIYNPQLTPTPKPTQIEATESAIISSPSPTQKPISTRKPKQEVRAVSTIVLTPSPTIVSKPDYIEELKDKIKDSNEQIQQLEQAKLQIQQYENEIAKQENQQETARLEQAIAEIEAKREYCKQVISQRSVAVAPNLVAREQNLQQQTEASQKRNYDKVSQLQREYDTLWQEYLNIYNSFDTSCP